jgi:hypothetical protein
VVPRSIGAAPGVLAPSGVAILGVVGGHELGYLLGGAADVSLATSHVHLTAATQVAHLFVAWLLLAIAVTDPRRGWTRGLTVPRLAGLQSALYVALEVGERIAQGAPLAELGSAPVLLGLAVQLPLAATLVLFARVVQAAVDRLLAAGPAPLLVPTGRPRCRQRSGFVPRSRRPLATTSRGPPPAPLLVAA